MIELLSDCCDEFLVYLSSVRNLSENTITGYRQDYNHLLAFLGKERRIQDVTLNDLRDCIGDLSKKKYSVTSINRFIAAVRGVFSYAKHFRHIQKNPALELKTLRGPKHLPKFMTQSEVDELCSQPDAKPLLWKSRDKALFEMLYSSGCRVSEMADLKFKDFTSDFKSAIVTGKGKKDRRVYFEEDARNALAEYLKERRQRFPMHEKDGAFPVENVFINQQGGPLRPQGMEYIVKRYSGIEGTGRQVSPHAFRHTFATQMLNNGADIRIVQEMLGHSSISTTQRYTHVTMERLKDVYRQAFPHSGKKD
ncbi:MAG: tyrosine-type recombinase/integrase [Treponema sp.]|nr:tyrosine-type recombinase/integrase [Spirochaetia bacterium]MDD7459699.1 tyrosine-type recombinase/integrase [Spirochaetales bacterium]MDY5811691.1 tyrosine-type recombinase/integrase [Treponema sp.]MEE1180904.1 tyrosine-type recombinase/integrase [Treponema sp.]